MTWTTIPPWLYQNDLPDDRLQEVYVREAERKWMDLVREREALEDELAVVRDAEGRAFDFFRSASEALGRYRRGAPQPPRARLTEKKRLPKP